MLINSKSSSLTRLFFPHPLPPDGGCGGTGGGGKEVGGWSGWCTLAGPQLKAGLIFRFPPEGVPSGSQWSQDQFGIAALLHLSQPMHFYSCSTQPTLGWDLPELKSPRFLLVGREKSPFPLLSPLGIRSREYWSGYTCLLRIPPSHSFFPP